LTGGGAPRIPSLFLVLGGEEGAPLHVIRIEREGEVAGCPFRHPDLIDVVVRLLLESVDLFLGEGGHRYTLDAVAEFTVDSAAIRTNEDAVGHIDIYGTLLTTVGALFVAGIAHKGPEDLLMLLLDGGHRGRQSGRWPELCQKVGLNPMIVEMFSKTSIGRFRGNGWFLKSKTVKFEIRYGHFLRHVTLLVECLHSELSG
jgi:hypothetical protein